MDVTLAAPTPSDAAEFITETRASTALHAPWIAPADSPARFDDYLDRAAGHDCAAYLIRHTSCGGLVGFVNVNSIVRSAFQSGYLGYAAFTSHAGRGLMAEGLAAVVDAAFGTLGLHRVEANIQPTNVRSIALARRLGFVLEGFSPRYLFVDGDWRDHQRWALRAEMWTA